MQKGLFIFLLFVNTCFAQQSDFDHIDYTKADLIAKSYRTKKLSNLNRTTFKLTEKLKTDAEKFRAIYVWICHNIANDYRLYALNDRKRKRFENDTIRLDKWNSRFKKILFKKLLKRKRTICTGYAYLLKEMCNIADIESKIVNGFARTGDISFEKLIYPNHTWNVVKLNGKWYLCDPTWSTGISYPDENKFIFQYNNGYFLVEPKIFIQNHFPVNSNYSLLNNEAPSLKEFSEMPLLYGGAYSVLKEHIAPYKMQHVIKQNDTFTFKYQLKKEIDLNKIKFIFSSNINRTIKPKISLEKDLLTLKHTFKKRGFYDVHLYIDKEIIATYTFSVTK
jgi:hypothetical protein